MKFSLENIIDLISEWMLFDINNFLLGKFFKVQVWIKTIKLDKCRILLRQDWWVNSVEYDTTCEMQFSLLFTKKFDGAVASGSSALSTDGESTKEANGREYYLISFICIPHYHAENAHLTRMVWGHLTSMSQELEGCMPIKDMRDFLYHIL